MRVINPTTIALTSTYGAAVAGTDAPVAVTPIDATHVKLPTDSTIAVGDLVVYRAPVSVPFTSGFVNVTLTQRDVGGTVITLPATNADGSTAHDPSASNIFVGSTFYDQLNTGDALTYTLRDGTGGMGLTSGTTYYVIKTGDGYTIRLASSHCEAVGPADPTCAPDVIALQLTLIGPDSVGHQLDRSLGQLVDGRVYFVTSYNPDTRAHHARRRTRRSAAEPRRDLPTRCSPHRPERGRPDRAGRP